ncbi:MULTISPECIES: DUF3108 domain-containing protein [Methylorubrum]|jgi:hypothetical protein|uniref:DUF3108 domain-containing protein n=1 Tax=Methylorubrum extorquens DSM 13060 TaxID=882800 RepID=H1KSI7_METEX|nr:MULTISPECIES: DUF3108 domain-containing protein [Methylorubrum]EHP87600.1 hypothetical protein MetexDRAFT_5600 [Methylorubrum extorquens DSM 13060]BDL41921.1 hypothetical protein MSPGM_45110 [Methylorubrum sp. GM97]
MRAKPILRAHLLLLAGALALPAGTQAAPRAHRAKSAPAGVAVDYSVNLAGIPIGNAQLTGAFDGARYRMDVSAVLTGLVGAVTGGQGSARSSGSIAAAPLPSAFSIATRTSSSGIAVRMALANGNVTQAEVTPPLLDTGDRVPVTAAAKRGVIDPASALMMPARARADLTDPENCNRTLPVFDGATRFNVVLSYGETRQVEKPGYSGPVLVCNARYVAIAGHRPDRPGVKFMEDNRDMSVWLAPVEGTRVLVPLRIAVRTTLGTNIIEATRWTRTGTATASGGEAQPGVVADASLSQQ